jgi:rhodanese-related sulfurtransferase
MKTTFKLLAISAAFMVVALVTYPASTLAAEPGWYPKIVNYKFVKAYAVIPKRNDVAIIDSRPMKRRYVNGHIPGAISIPNSQFDKMTRVLPQEKSMALIFYCGGKKCMLSHKSAFKAEKLGYTNIQVYAAGYPDWIANGELASVSAAYVKKVLDGGKATVIDARPMKRKYAKGHVPGAISIPNSQFDKLAHMLPAEKSAPLIFYCGGMKCPLSVKSAIKAKALSYTNVKVFQGGYPEWKKMYGKGAMGMGGKFNANAKSSAIEVGPEGDTITVASFQVIMKNNPDSVYLYDVRDVEEFAKGAMVGAVNIPVEELEDKVATLPTDKPIVFVCSTGARSGEAYDIVKMVKGGMKVYFVDAAIDFHGKDKYKIAQN